MGFGYNQRDVDGLEGAPGDFGFIAEGFDCFIYLFHLVEGVAGEGDCQTFVLVAYEVAFCYRLDFAFDCVCCFHFVPLSFICLYCIKS